MQILDEISAIKDEQEQVNALTLYLDRNMSGGNWDHVNDIFREAILRITSWIPAVLASFAVYAWHARLEPKFIMGDDFYKVARSQMVNLIGEDRVANILVFNNGAIWQTS